MLILAVFTAIGVHALQLRANAVELPADPPIPISREEALRKDRDRRDQKDRGADNGAAEATESTTITPDLPASEAACRAKLRALEVAFAEAPPVEAKQGCALPHPIKVSKLSPGIRLQPAAVLNCATARAAAEFFQVQAMMAAQKHLEERIEAVLHASAYVCRPINGGGRLSEHAFGNALDVSGLLLSGGLQVVVREPDQPDGPEARFLQELRDAACGPFSTVLGPGTNAAHADHFHFDMKKRRNPYCR